MSASRSSRHPEDGRGAVPESLFERAVGGDGTAVEELVARYLPRLRAFVRSRMGEDLRKREASCDLVQSICRELIARREGFEFRGEAQFRGWLFTSALNKIRQRHEFHHMQKRDLRREVGPLADPLRSEEALVAAYATVCTPSQEASAREQIARFEAAFDRLPSDYREVITLARLAQLPHDEVAARMERTIGAVRQLLGRALVKLSYELERTDA